jgi:hypothetical protein
MMVVVPPKAALVVPLRNPSAITAPAEARPGAFGWSRWQCASIPPGSAIRDPLGDGADAAIGDAEIGAHHIRGGGDGAAANDQIEGHAGSLR